MKKIFFLPLLLLFLPLVSGNLVQVNYTAQNIYSNTSINDFSIQLIDQSFSDSVLFESFDRTDSATVGNGWHENETIGTFSIENNSLKINRAGGVASYLTKEVNNFTEFSLRTRIKINSVGNLPYIRFDVNSPNSSTIKGYGFVYDTNGDTFLIQARGTTLIGGATGTGLASDLDIGETWEFEFSKNETHLRLKAWDITDSYPSTYLLTRYVANITMDANNYVKISFVEQNPTLDVDIDFLHISTQGYQELSTTNGTISHTANESNVYTVSFLADEYHTGSTNITYDNNKTVLLNFYDTILNIKDNANDEFVTATCTINGYSSTNSVFYYAIKDYDNTSVTCTNSSYYDQTVNLFSVTYPQTINLNVNLLDLYINFYYENNNSLTTGRNVSVELIGTDFSVINSTTTGQTYLRIGFPDDYIIRWSAEGYSSRYYLFSLSNNEMVNLSLYLSDGVNITAIITDQNLYELEGAILNVEKYVQATNSYEIRERGIADFEGKVRFIANLYDEFYRFKIYYEDDLVFTSIPTTIKSETINFIVTVGQAVGEDYYDLLNLDYSLYFDNSSNRFVFSHSNALGIVNNIKLETYRITSRQNEQINQTITTSNSGTIYHAVNNITGYNYRSCAYGYLNGKYQLIDCEDARFTENTPESSKNLMLFFLILITTLFALLGVYSISMALILTPIPFVVFELLGYTTIGLPYAISILLLFVIIAIIINRT